MQREIKFRAWDKKKSRMLLNVATGVVNLIDVEANTSAYYTDCVYMQFTGLKDKNDVDIYEGDVVNHPYNPEETITLTFDPHQIHRLIEFGEWDALSTTEVIGNIYQNPELLQS